ncbi:hypothetical protein [Amycolatopsis sp. MtRt-6]|nr:hypothetical protein [Amycolatopsis sp. MtRt-6]
MSPHDRSAGQLDQPRHRHTSAAEAPFSIRHGGYYYDSAGRPYVY